MAGPPEPKNALWRREEQLTRWDQSETNKESAEFRDRSKSKVTFQDGCVFLAACSSCDQDEVEDLLTRGADINTANIDGLTALHQACIDDNLDMVKFLVEKGADIDACDNEGWTALHATASCGFLDIAKYLVDQGANVAAVNNDGELPIDISEGDDMEELLFNEMESQGVDAEGARVEEEEVMLADANQWLNGEYNEELHPKTGATALHVAAAKGYLKVMNILISAGVDLNVKDYDGWTPLHAAAHWGQEDACKILVENFCNMEIKNVGGQTALDIADPDMINFLKELKQKQASLKKDREANMKDTILPRQPPPLKRRSSVTRMSVGQKQDVIMKNVEEERAQYEAMLSQSLDEKEEEKKKKQNEINRQSILSKSEENGAPSENAKMDIENDKDEDREKDMVTEDEKSENEKKEAEKDEMEKVADDDSEKDKENENEPAKTIEITEPLQPIPPPQDSITPRISDIAKSEELQRDADKEKELQNVSLEKLSEIEKNDEKPEKLKSDEIQQKYSLRQDSDVGDIEENTRRRPVSTSGVTDATQDARNRRQMEIQQQEDAAAAAAAAAAARQTSPLSTTTCPTISTTATTTTATTSPTSSIHRRSFEPPKMTEERETERKAKAKRARESRRSTQGVSKEHIQMAEQTLQAASRGVDPPTEGDNRLSTKLSTDTTEDYTYRRRYGSTVDEKAEDDIRNSYLSRRPRDSALLDTTTTTATTTVSSYTPRTSVRSTTSPTSSITSSSLPSSLSTTSTTLSSGDAGYRPYRSKYLHDDDSTDSRKDDEKEREDPSQKSSAIRARRKRDSRKLTGKITAEDLQGIMKSEDTDKTSKDIKDDTSSRYGASRFSDSTGSTTSSYDRSAPSYSSSRTDRPTSYSGTGLNRSSYSSSTDREPDYKKLYEDEKLENEKLRKEVKKLQSELTSSSDKRERRALERKVSEMEEELKVLETLRADNQRLKDENGALIRVISKLSK